MRNILEYLEATVRRKPYETAFSDGEKGMTFREVYDQARAIGSFLLSRELRGKPVAVLLGREPRTVAAFLGAIYGDCYYVPLDREMPRERLEQILATLTPGALICAEEDEKLAESLNCGEIIPYGRAAFGIIREEALAQVRETQLDTDPIYVVFTSGSTGVPKGVIGSHRAVIDYIENLCPVLKFHEKTVFGNQTPLYFDACLKELLPALKFGGRVVFIPKKLFTSPVRLVEFLNQQKINTLCWVTSALTLVSSLGTFETIRPRFLQTVAFASEVFPVRQLEKWRRACPGARFLNLYGPTETTGICCYYEVDREFSEEETLPIGRPFPNTQILLLDETGKPAAPGEPGEICIRGTRLTLGYYRDEQRTAEAFIQNPLQDLYPEKIYRTGDLGRYNDRGELLFLGRRDNQIKHMGHRIELGEIETAAAALAGVRSVCCVYDGENQRIVLYYTGPREPRLLGEGLKEKLPRYMLPQTLRHLTAMPMTPNGKIDRNLLRRAGGK